MVPTPSKILLVAHDSHGREVLLARFDDGRLRIVIDGDPQAAAWPYPELKAAVREYMATLPDLISRTGSANSV